MEKRKHTKHIGVGGGIDLFVSGASPQSHGLDFESSF
jgi:hypothetical protein